MTMRIHLLTAILFHAAVAFATSIQCLPDGTIVQFGAQGEVPDLAHTHFTAKEQA